MGRIKNSNVILTCGLAFFGAAFALGAVVAVNSENNQVYEEVHADPDPEPISYISRSYVNGAVVSTENTCSSYAVYNGQDTLGTENNTSWYVVNSNISGPLYATQVLGRVNLIICDGRTLTMDRGMFVDDTLNIYGQSLGTGTLNVSYNWGSEYAAIRVSSGKTLNIHGGIINANGSTYGAAIGGDNNGSCGTVNIFGGTVTATSNYCAGIGGGGNYSGNAGNGGTVNIYGGTVNARGDGHVGIGSGDNNGNHGTLTLGTGMGAYEGENRRTDYASNRWNNMTIKPLPVVAYKAWDGTSVEDVEGGCTDYTVVTSSTTSLQNGKWYVVNDDVTVSSRINVSGTAHLILCDDKTLTASKGIGVNQGNTLNIYGQSGNTGKIIATGSNYNAAIGGSNAVAGTIVIHGGDITANGNGSYAAGVGGGKNDNGTTIIYGGNVAASGGGSAAGIGGGLAGNGGTISIFGGNITASGGSYSAGIGGADTGNGGTITIYGGNITANSGMYYAAGIGGGGNESNPGAGANVTIHGGVITASGGVDGVGIGAGKGDSSKRGQLAVD
ncbi:MAG: hypothetical protein J5618_01700, partial [Bacilli bacterium]|nr:hypothetical protein [Bacilli bacterium]